MAYPVHAVTMPAALSGKTNGKLPDSVLESTPGQAGGPVVRLVSPAARSWRAFTASALQSGHTLKATSIADSYRSYAIQESTFRARYTTTPLAGRPSVMWNGRRWYQRPNTAVAAVPGTSNHGWGLAIDTGEERDSDAGTESLDNPTLAWMIANEGRFGFSHELQSEPWHIRYWAGDNIPNAVLEFEKNGQGDDEMADIFLRGERGEIVVMAGNTVRGIADMRSMALNLAARGMKSLAYVSVAMADVRNGIYGVDIYTMDDAGRPTETVKLSDADMEKLAALLEARTHDEISRMLDQEFAAHFATAPKA
jgi:D-alanyl-D-alanine carboxypeptidase